MKLPDDVVDVLGLARGIEDVVLVGSRAEGRARAESDWDFRVVTTDFESVRKELPSLVEPLAPVVAQWDRLSRTWCYILILVGAVKVDLIFDQPHQALPPWSVTRATLGGVDDHFWDWVL